MKVNKMDHIDIPDQLAHYVRMLNYEMNGTRVLITAMISSHDDDKLDSILSYYLEVYATYRLVIESTIFEQCRDTRVKQWKIDYDNEVIHFERTTDA